MKNTTETCPSLEDLAVFLDGRLGAEERAQVVEHLAGCKSCYRVFAEAARFQEESAAAREAEAAQPPVPFEGGAERRRWLPVAAWRSAAAGLLAATLLLAAGIPVYRYFTVVPEMDSAALIAALGDPATVESKLWGARGVMRGGEETPRELPPDEECVRLGVQLVDLQVALSANDKDGSRIAAEQLVFLLRQMRLPPEKLEKFYEGLRKKLESGAPLRELLPLASARERTGFEVEFDRVDRVYINLGKWAEAGRLAAIARRSQFFTSWRTRHFLDVLLRQQSKDEELKLKPEAARRLDWILAATASTPLRPPVLESLGGQCSGLIEEFSKTPLS